ncbi:MAG: nucleoid occlusion factor SlmA [Gammaproteobacteria bacterium]|nr:MAG: nucleoid occlusion factor SlmA [Gammaproteobacteria bacterium]
MVTHKQSRRDQILVALAEMMESSPHGRITTAALARHLGVSEAALYRHFPSKAKMYEGLIEFIEETIFTRIRIILENEPGVEARCHAILTLVLSFCERNPGISRILSGDALTGETERLHHRAAQILDRIETQIKQIFREAEIGENKRTVMSVNETAEMLLALTEGKVRQFVRSDFSRLPTDHWPQQWHQIIDNLFR